MTNEELEEEAETYWINQPPFTEIRDRVIQAYIDSAESREKQIAELEKENAELKRDLEELTITNDYQKVISDKNEQLSYLESQSIKAIEIIRYLCRMVRDLNEPNIQLTDVNYSLKEAEQFLKDYDIDKDIQQANEGIDFDKIEDEIEHDSKESEGMTDKEIAEFYKEVSQGQARVMRNSMRYFGGK